MHIELILSGTGGQGILVMGQLLAQAALKDGLNVVLMPSYGPETRGGTSDCSIIVSADPIGSPVICNPDILVAMHQIALDKYLGSLRREGLLVVNSSLAKPPASYGGSRIVSVPASEAAFELGDGRVANMVAVGALIAASPHLNADMVKQALSEIIPERHKKLLPLNMSALERGMDYAAALAATL